MVDSEESSVNITYDRTLEKPIAVTYSVVDVMTLG